MNIIHAFGCTWTALGEIEEAVIAQSTNSGPVYLFGPAAKRA